MIAGSSPSSAAEPAGRRGWGLTHVFVGFVASQVASLVALLVVVQAVPLGTALAVEVAQAASGDQLTVLSGQTQTAMALVLLPLWVTQLATVAYASWGRGLGPTREVGLALRVSDVPYGIALGVIAQLAVTALYRLLDLLTGDLGVDEPARQLTGRASGIGVVGLFLLYAAAAPFVEELFFRGLLLRSLERRSNRWLALVSSAVLFAAVHVQLVQFPGLVIAGLVFGYAAQSRRRLGPAIFAHAAFNAFTVAGLLLSR